MSGESIRDAHPSWIPKKCPVDDCDLIFKSAQSLKTHLQTIHKIADKAILKEHTYGRTGRFPAQSCSFPECEYPTVYKEKRHYVKHLKSHHQVEDGDTGSYIILE